jgi:peptidyl-prolyl cis-trans isomerase D
MLQDIRDKMQNHRWFTYLVLGALTLVFTIWGVYSIADIGIGATRYAAKVNGDTISTELVNDLWQRQQARLSQVSTTLDDTQRAAMQQKLLDDEIRALAVTQYAEKIGYRVTAEQLSQAYQTEPSFQVDGRFNHEEAKSRLAQAGMSEAAYVKDLRRTLLVNQLLGSVGVSDFWTPAELKRVFALLDEEREVRYVMLESKAFASATPDAAAIQAYYSAHSEDFMRAESVQLAYAELSVADVTAVQQVTDAMLRARYERDKASYITPENRRPSHILIAVDGTTDDAKAAALAKEVHAKIKAGGDFAALAKQYSKDAASAAKGGQLDWAGRDVYVTEFTDKLFAMKQGEVSEPVKTQFGYHIIRLDGIRAESGRSFEQVKAELSATLRNELAASDFSSREDGLQEKLESGGSSLDQLVKEFGMRRGEVAQFERGAGGLPLGSDAELNQAVFSDAVLTQGRVGGPVQLGEDRITIFQVLKHRKAEPKPLEEVRAEIVSILQREQGEKAALAAAEAAVAKLGAGESFDKVAAGLRAKAAPAKFVSRGSPELPVEVRDAVFAAVRPVPGKPFRQAIKVEGAGVALVEVTASRVSQLLDNPELLKMRSERELQKYARRNADSYVAEIVGEAKIRKNPQAFQQ